MVNWSMENLPTQQDPLVPWPDGLWRALAPGKSRWSHGLMVYGEPSRRSKIRWSHGQLVYGEPSRRNKIRWSHGLMVYGEPTHAE